MSTPKRSSPPTLTTYYVRGFPRELARRVAAAAALRGITIGEMLAIVVREGLRAVDRAADREGAA